MNRLRNTMRPVSFSWSGLGPIILSFIAALIMLLPLGTDADSHAMPHLVMMSVYYWSSFRPMQMPVGAAALIGFFLDLWLGVPLGLNMLLMVLVRVFVLTQLRYLRGRPMLVSWFIFGGFAALLYILSWALTSFVNQSFVLWGPVVEQLLITIVFYPVLVFIYHQIRKRMR